MKPENRKVKTKITDSSTLFLKLCLVSSIREDDNIVVFNDGSFGLFYQIIGNASTLLFEKDRDAILFRTDMFYRKIKPDFEISFITTKEPQNVVKQVNYLKKCRETIKFDSVKELIDNEIYFLEQKIGREYKSIHQYMLIKANNLEALKEGSALIDYELRESGFFLKSAKVLGKQDVENLCKVIFT